MGVLIQDRVPDKFSAGDSISWTKANSDCPADEGWEVTYYFRGPQQFSVVGSAYQTSDYLFELEGADTASKTAGVYWYDAYADDGTDRVKIDEGEVELLVNLETYSDVTEYDGRSTVKKILDAIRATLEDKATADQGALLITYSGMQRQVSKIPVADLLLLEKRYAGLYAGEVAEGKLEAGLASGNLIKTEFYDS
jgi:hypothetical protein